MPRFTSFFKSGRTTPTPQPYVPSTNPPTPVSANPSQLRSLQTPTSSSTTGPPSSFKYATPSSDRVSTETLSSMRSVDQSASSASSTPSTRESTVGSRCTPVRSTAAKSQRSAPLPSNSRLSPSSSRQGGMSLESTNVLAPLLPPPTYDLPPTPRASPQKRVSAVHLGSGGSSDGKLDANIRPVSRADGPLPPTSFKSSMLHARTASSSTPRVRSQSGRARSASSGSRDVDRQQQQKDSSNTLRGISQISLETTMHVARPSGEDTTSNAPEAKHRPAALKLRTSNLIPGTRQSDTGQRRIVFLSGKEDDAEQTKADYNDRHPRWLRATLQPPKDRSAKEEAGDRAGSDDSSHTVTPDQRPILRRIESAEPVLRPLRLVERRRSRSTGDAIQLLNSTVDQQNGKPGAQRSSILPHGTEQSVLQRRPSHKYTHSTSSSSIYTPSSVLSDLSATPAESLTRVPAPHLPKPFENLPLPWSTAPFPTLVRDLGAAATLSLVDYTLTHAHVASPSLLTPMLLKTSVSEDLRLRAELSRLQEKYNHLILHRESLSGQINSSLLKADPAKMHKMFQALGKVMARCDRVARQIYICNDQIRQIEIQGQEHVVGALRVALSEKEKELESTRRKTSMWSPLASCNMSVRSSPASDVELSVGMAQEDPDLFSTASTITPPSAADDSVTVILQSPVKQQSNVLYDIQPGSRAGKQISPIADNSRPASTATMISVNHLTFPIPPDRRRRNVSTALSSAELEVKVDSEAGHHTSSGTYAHEDPALPLAAETESQPDLDADMESYDTHTTVSSNEDTEIVIYPPGHHRSISAPLLLGDEASSMRVLDMPYTPWRSETHDAAPSSTHSHGRSVSESGCLTPSPLANGLRPTAPLRITTRPHTNFVRATAKSVSSKGSAISEEKRRARRGRESQLETPESILLSLATAPLWTKHFDANYGDEEPRMFS